MAHIMHTRSALKLEKSAISKVQKFLFMLFQKWQKINFCKRKKFKHTLGDLV